VSAASFSDRRWIHALVALATAVPILVLVKLPWAARVAVPVLGAWLGALYAGRVWRRMRERIDRRNALILYFSDSAVYVLLIGGFLLAKAKLASFNITWAAFEFPGLAGALAVLSVGAWCGHAIRLYREVRGYEREHGPLYTKSFYSRAVTGQQGMLGLEGVVTRGCEPEGKVELRGEIWDAVSIDGRPIEVGSEIVVRDIEEMLLIVEPVRRP
jgi:membrane protein implicated in regulation of membrane protease activity